MTPADLPNTRPRIGLALGSGLARGWAHIGALRALVKYGFIPDLIAGTSMGALVGGAYASDNLGVLEDWARSLTRMKVIGYLDVSVREGGLIGGRKLYKVMRENFGDVRIEDLNVHYVAVTADMITGHEVWLKHGDLVDAMRASFSLPGVFPPVPDGHRLLVDGALVNPVPVSICQAMNCQMTIAINLNGDILGKVRKPGNAVATISGFDPLADGALPQEWTDRAKHFALSRRLFKREEDSPSLMGVMVSSLNIVQDRLARSRLAGDPPDVLINPRIGHIGLMEFEKVDELIKAGEDAVERALPELQDAYRVLVMEHGGM